MYYFVNDLLQPTLIGITALGWNTVSCSDLRLLWLKNENFLHLTLIYAKKNLDRPKILFCQWMHPPIKFILKNCTCFSFICIYLLYHNSMKKMFNDNNESFPNIFNVSFTFKGFSVWHSSLQNNFRTLNVKHSLVFMGSFSGALSILFFKMQIHQVCWILQ